MSNKNNLNKILFIGCHCDDIELGCGATIDKWKNKQIDCIILSQKTIDEKSLKKTSTKSLKKLGVKNLFFYDFSPSKFHEKTQQIWEKLIKFDTDYGSVFFQESDHHQDHETLYKVTNRMFQGKNLFTYCASPISCPNFKPNFFVEISKKNLKIKLKSLKNYKIYKNKPYFDKKLIKSIAKINGSLAMCNLAEGYRIKRIINNI